MSEKHAWAEPGVFEVADRVFRIPLVMPTDGLRAINVYAIIGDTGPTLLDSGWPTPQAREQLVRALRMLGCAPADVERILVTHVHRDHYGIAAQFQREFATPIVLGEHERPSLEFLGGTVRKAFTPQITMLREAGAAELLVQFEAIMGHSEVDPADWPMPDSWSVDGTALQAGGRALRAVHTPGHTRGHVVFRDEQDGLLFSGDHVLPQITPSIALEPVPPTMPLRDFLDSLSLVRGLPDTRLLPAHGPVTDSAHARVDELLDHHAQRLDEMAATLQATGVSAAQSAAQLGWTRRQHNVADLDPFNAMLAVLETRAHLDLLVAQGRAQVEKLDGVWVYRPSSAAPPVA